MLVQPLLDEHAESAAREAKVLQFPLCGPGNMLAPAAHQHKKAYESVVAVFIDYPDEADQWCPRVDLLQELGSRLLRIIG